MSSNYVRPQRDSVVSITSINSNSSTDTTFPTFNCFSVLNYDSEKNEDSKEAFITTSNFSSVDEYKINRSNSDLNQSEHKGELQELEWTFDDQGMRGVLVIIGCSLLAATGLGYSFIFGVWLDELAKNVYPDVPLSTLNMISGLSNCCMTITGFVSGRMADTYGYKPIIFVSIISMSLSLIASAFAYQSLPGIFIVQGACIGISIGIGMPLHLSLPSQWYKKHRGLASGITASGAGFGGGIAAIIIRQLLPMIGYRYTMLVYAGMSTVVMRIAFLLIETRLPTLKEGETRVPRAWLPTACFKDVAFYSFIGAMIIALFGYLSPFYYITAYIGTIDSSLASSSIATIFPLVAMNFSGSFGRIFAGLLADKIGPVNTMYLSFLLAGLSQVLVWPFARSYGSAMVFATFYGATGTIASLLPHCCAQLFGTQGLATIVGFGFLSHFPGQLLGATLSGLVLTSSGGSYTRVAIIQAH